MLKLSSNVNERKALLHGGGDVSDADDDVDDDDDDDEFVEAAMGQAKNHVRFEGEVDEGGGGGSGGAAAAAAYPRQGLTLVHFSAQPEPFLTSKTP